MSIAARAEPVPAEPVAPVRSDAAFAAHAFAFWKLTLGTLGVVHGGIGTSPLHALEGSLAAGGALAREMVFGVVPTSNICLSSNGGPGISSCSEAFR